MTIFQWTVIGSNCHFFKCLNLTFATIEILRQGVWDTLISFSLVWAMFSWYIADVMALSDAVSRMTGDFFLKQFGCKPRHRSVDDVLGGVTAYATTK